MDILRSTGFGAQEETAGSGWVKWKTLSIEPLKGRRGCGKRETHALKATWSQPLFHFTISPQYADRLGAWDSVGDTCGELDRARGARFGALSV